MKASDPQASSEVAYLGRLREAREALVSRIQRPPVGYGVSIETAPDLLGSLAQYTDAVRRLRAIESSSLFLWRSRLVVLAGRRPAQGHSARRSRDSRRGLQADYQRWIEECDVFTARDSELVLAHIRTMKSKPVLGLVWAVEDGSQVPERLMESLQAQLYGDFRLTIVARAGPDVNDRPRDPRCEIVAVSDSMDFAAGLNLALSRQTAEWVLVLNRAAALPPQALFCFAHAAAGNQSAQLIYSDEDQLDETGHRCEPNFKSDWNAPLLGQMDNLGTAVLFRRSRMQALGGFGGSLWESWIRYTDGLTDAEVVHLPHVLLHGRGGPCESREANPAPFAKVPKVSLVIPTKNGLELLRACIESIEAVSEHRDFEYVIVDNGSDDRAALAYLAELAARRDAKVIRAPGPFNYAALNNLGAFHADGEVLGFINNDLEIVQPDWMSRLATWAMKPGIGIVGARLLYPDGTIQHGGVAIGFSRLQLEHTIQKLGEPLAAYQQRLRYDQWATAVMGACMFVRKSVYEEVGGMDSESFPVLCNDVDLCLKARLAGYRNIYAGSVACTHHESKSRGSDDTLEKAKFAQGASAKLAVRWGVGCEDPAYNPNLELWRTRFGIAKTPRVPRPWLR